MRLDGEPWWQELPDKEGENIMVGPSYPTYVIADQTDYAMIAMTVAQTGMTSSKPYCADLLSDKENCSTSNVLQLQQSVLLYDPSSQTMPYNLLLNNYAC